MIGQAHHERRFFELFEGVFTGADIEGRTDSGYINLLRMKRRHFHHFRLGFEQKLLGILAEARIGEYEKAERNELYDKLYSFFSRYFSESGAVFFRHTPAWQPIYQRIDDPGRDVLMVWKTGMLHYVKTDTLARGMTVHLDSVLHGKPRTGFRFQFDASQLQTRQNNERRDFAFAFGGEGKDEKGKKTAIIRITRPPKGAKKGGGEKVYEELAKEAKAVFAEIGEDDVCAAIGVFRKQTEADFFISKDAGGFLREQFDLWMFQYVFGGESEFDKKRLNQLRALRRVAGLVIGFVAEFENELLRVWEKPKLARGVNYVITLDRLPDALKTKAAAARGAKMQAEEWAESGLTEKGVSVKDIIVGGKKAKKTDARFLPLDTRYFKELESEMLAALAAKDGGLDAALDGELVRSENWQALNTLAKKYRGRVKCVYIDPPFNLGGGDKFDYRTNYKDSSWATMLHGRLLLAREFLAEDGAIFVRCDYNGNHIVRFLLDGVFGGDNFMNEIALSRGTTPQGELTKMETGYDTLHFYARNKDECAFEAPLVKREVREWQEMHLPSERTEDHLRYRIIDGEKRYPPKGRHWALAQQEIDDGIKAGTVRIKPEREYTDTEGNRVKGMPESFQGEFRRKDANWTDIPGYSSTMANVVGENFPTENAEVALARVVNSGALPGGVVIDFFAGSGTTMAVAQKLGRKWLGVEMGEHFDTVILPRMKKVLAGHRSGINNGNGNGKNGNGKKSCDYKGGGAFKYYALEQYEESLALARYADDEPSFADAPYIFCKDEKMTWPVAVKGKKLALQLHKLFADLDIAETLSHLRGLPIAARADNAVTLSDGDAEECYRTDVQTMPEDDKRKLLAVLKPALWWE